MLTSVIVAAVVAVAHPVAAPVHQPGCRTRACDARVLRRHRRAAWARRHPWKHERNRIYRAAPGLRDELKRLRACESGGRYHIDGHHDGAYQYDYRTWMETLGYLPRRLRARATSAPAYAASPPEQDVRTARFYPSHRGRWQCVA
jgi:hypothetical protein